MRGERGSNHLPNDVVRADSIAPGTDITVYASGGYQREFPATIISMRTVLAQPNNPAIIVSEKLGSDWEMKASIGGATKVIPIEPSIS